MSLIIYNYINSRFMQSIFGWLIFYKKDYKLKLIYSYLRCTPFKKTLFFHCGLDTQSSKKK